MIPWPCLRPKLIVLAAICDRLRALRAATRRRLGSRGVRSRGIARAMVGFLTTTLSRMRWVRGLFVPEGTAHSAPFGTRVQAMDMTSIFMLLIVIVCARTKVLAILFSAAAEGYPAHLTLLRRCAGQAWRGAQAPRVSQE